VTETKVATEDAKEVCASGAENRKSGKGEGTHGMRAMERIQLYGRARDNRKQSQSKVVLRTIKRKQAS
jgi:hypothetical protein